ncbi:hypothetical protein H696_03952 [Fonticula alba]|uniref:WW domain-containing protein n=1 Tax=Fonticula alba TaxID=691883 RepID=A0A058Z610_FONAL|nr:hypothetical protein H696_03952 [Fonticula alba]KCV69531.1 hypothetical protein H696_03952 [Fonticula alba]|eukprot:XP_009496096.1 hypothetical protein H696_03952 [Fonticula alba]
MAHQWSADFQGPPRGSGLYPALSPASGGSSGPPSNNQINVSALLQSNGYGDVQTQWPGAAVASPWAGGAGAVAANTRSPPPYQMHTPLLFGTGGQPSPVFMEPGPAAPAYSSPAIGRASPLRLSTPAPHPSDLVYGLTRSTEYWAHGADAPLPSASGANPQQVAPLVPSSRYRPYAMPAGWDLGVGPDGRTYFRRQVFAGRPRPPGSGAAGPQVDDMAPMSWVDPRVSQQVTAPPVRLPPGWECYVAVPTPWGDAEAGQNGNVRPGVLSPRLFYVDHNRKITTWVPPVF